MSDRRSNYNRAVGVTKFLAEGHTIGETKTQFKVGKNTIIGDVRFLTQQRYDSELCKKAKAQLQKESGKCKKRKK